MSVKYLGKNFEIHGGGRDLIFPHHENEIAQSESFTSEQFAKIWMHAGMITINGEKMSKSIGNVKSINSLAADEKISKNISEQTLPVLEYMLDVLGLKIQTVSDDEIKSTFDLIAKREKLREGGKFEEADKIRDQIASLGISLIDHKNKTLWMKKEVIKAEKQ